MDAGLDELGMDSLVAVEIRSWFLKELSTDVTVLEVLNSGTARALLQSVKERIFTALAVAPDSKPPTTIEQQPSPKAIALEVAPEAKIAITDTASDNFETRSESKNSSSESGSLLASRNVLDSTVMSTATSSPTSAPVELDSDCKPDALGLPLSEDLVTRSVPLSFGQSRFWFLKHFLPDETAFNITTVIHMQGNLDIDRLASSVNAVANHHEALRTAFVSGKDQPMQIVLKTSPLKLERKQIMDAEEVAPAYEAIKRYVYDLEAGQTMRIQLLTLSPTAHFLILGYHHINMDGLSFEVFFNDIQKAYEGSAFTPGVIQYPDFAIREHEEYRLGEWKPELDFWRNEFTDLPEPLPLLPLSRKFSRPAITQYGTARVERRIPAELSALIKTTARKFKSGVFAFYLAILKALIVRYVDVDDLCIGMADANRKQSDVLGSLGLYLNLVPLRLACNSSQPFSDSLEEMHRKSQLAFANARVPFDVILNELGVPRSASHPPLFQVFMNYRQGVREIREFCDCECEGELLSGGELAYDISFDVVENPGGETNVMLSVQRQLYDESSAGVLLDSFFNLLEAFAGNPASRIRKPALYKQLAIDEALELGCGPTFEHAWPTTIPHRIDDLIKEYPDKLALTDGNGTDLSYAQMGALVDSIAATLDDKVNANGIIGVLQHPTPASICSILAIMKAGRTFVPLDPRVGPARLAMIAAESKLSCVVVDNSIPADSSFLPSDTILVNVADLPGGQQSTYPIMAQPDGLAALIYTSGSTGIPKGITLSHASLRNNVELSVNHFGMKIGVEVILQQTAFSFDMSLFQIFCALGNAATLVVVPRDVRGDSSALASLMVKTGVTVTAATPAEYVSLIRHGATVLKKSDKWRVACSGGEKVTDLLVASFRSLAKEELVLVNAYGPAETTFLCSLALVPYHEVQKSATLTLRTLPNYAVYIVGEDLKPVPVGVPGEVCIGGAGVGLGYHNNTELTSQRFPPNPYANDAFKSQGWTNMHITGDRGRLRPDGQLILEGRITGDSQVKVRGIRIELEEVELSIMQESQGAIIQAAASVRTDDSSGSDYLVAHVVMKAAGAEGEDLAYLQQLPSRLSFPQYMRPSAIVSVSALPLNISNKLDRQALQSLPVTGSTMGITGASENLSRLQDKVKQLWERVIPGQVLRGEIDAMTDFFHVGGTSLLLVELQALFKEKLGSAPTVQQLFQSSTLEGMASLVEGAPAEENSLPADWDAEAALLPNAMYEGQEMERAISGPAKVIVLTGATGFLGSHILERLLGNKEVEKVFCIAVRKKTSELPVTFGDSRVEVFPGDLGAADLGLSAADAQRIFRAADVVIHNGADVSFMKTYASLRRTNVDATKQIARLAMRRRIPFHFVSSASVTQLTPLEEIGEISVAAYPPSADADGYITAKWVSERHLELVAEAHGLPVTIHRPASISGNDASDSDLMGNLFRFVERLEAVPESKEWKGYFDLISVHTVATAIMKAAMGEQRTGGVRYQYEAGEMVYPLSTMEDVAKSMEDFPIRTMPLEEWVEQAEEKGLNPLLGAYLRGAAARNSRWAFPKLIKG